jgi:multidrug transporter EmrE-like cation transporter
MKTPVLLLLLLGVFLNALAQLGLKSATATSGAITLERSSLIAAAGTLLSTPVFWAALAAYGLSVIVWVIGLSRVPVSQAYPLLSLGYVLTALGAWAMLGETLSMQRIAGIAVIIVGVFLVSRS